jgi:PP-loop superfamily ATP-utilizing enzyme
MDNKLIILQNSLKKYKSSVIAFSGGVDSTFLAQIAKAEGYDVVFDGSNADDLNDFRPGLKAISK